MTKFYSILSICIFFGLSSCRESEEPQAPEYQEPEKEEVVEEQEEPEIKEPEIIPEFKCDTAFCSVNYSGKNFEDQKIDNFPIVSTWSEKSKYSLKFYAYNFEHTRKYPISSGLIKDSMITITASISYSGEEKDIWKIGKYECPQKQDAEFDISFIVNYEDGYSSFLFRNGNQYAKGHIEVISLDENGACAKFDIKDVNGYRLKGTFGGGFR